MHAIVKVVGVTPEALAKLHATLKRDDLRTKGEHYQLDDSAPIISSIAVSSMRVPYATLLDSKLHPASGTYTVSLKMNLVIRSYSRDEDTSVEREGTPLVFPPLGVFAEVLKSIDPRLLPEIETVDKPLPTPTNVIDALVEKLLPILGEKSDFDITNGQTGAFLIPANRKITRTMVRKLAEQIKDLWLEKTNDRVIGIIKRVRDEFIAREKNKGV